MIEMKPPPTDTLGSLSEENRTLFHAWIEELGPDVLIQFYKDDGLDNGIEEWAEGPHLAVLLEGDASFAWPVGFDGWADPRETSWEAVKELQSAGLRTPPPDPSSV